MARLEGDCVASRGIVLTCYSSDVCDNHINGEGERVGWTAGLENKCCIHILRKGVVGRVKEHLQIWISIIGCGRIIETHLKYIHCENVNATYVPGSLSSILMNDTLDEPISTRPGWSVEVITTLKYSDSSVMLSSMVDTIKVAFC